MARRVHTEHTERTENCLGVRVSAHVEAVRHVIPATAGIQRRCLRGYLRRPRDATGSPPLSGGRPGAQLPYGFALGTVVTAGESSAWAARAPDPAPSRCASRRTAIRPS